MGSEMCIRDSEVGKQPGRRPDRQGQHPCHRWIKGAAMADFAGTQRSPGFGDTVMGGAAGRLVDHQKAA